MHEIEAANERGDVAASAIADRATTIGRSQAAGERALSAHLADGAAELHWLRKHLRTCTCLGAS